MPSRRFPLCSSCVALSKSQKEESSELSAKIFKHNNCPPPYNYDTTTTSNHLPPSERNANIISAWSRHPFLLTSNWLNRSLMSKYPAPVAYAASLWVGGWQQDGDKTETRWRQDGKQDGKQEGAKVRRHVLGKVRREWDRNKKKEQKEQQQKTTRPTRPNQEVLALIC